MKSPQIIRNNAATLFVSLFLLLPAAACDNVVGFELDADGSETGDSSDTSDGTDTGDSTDTSDGGADADPADADDSETGDAGGRDTNDPDTMATDVDADDVRDVSADVADTDVVVDMTPPSVVVTFPVDSATGVAINRAITAEFSEAIDPLTLTDDTFVVTGPGTAVVAGSTSYLGRRAMFTPDDALLADTEYTATIAETVADLAGNPLEAEFEWTFSTSAEEGSGPEPVFLGSAGNYVILSKSGINTIPSSIITGNVGVSPIDATAITGFSETIDSTGRFSTSDQVTGQIHAANYGVPTPSLLTAAISAVETAYTDAAGRSLPTTTELGGGEIGGLTIEPGLHKWSSAVTISTSVTLNGGPNDVWIFQIAGGITQASDTQVLLTGGASPDNIFWQSFGDVVLDTDAHIEGIVLSQTTIILRTGASARGRLLAQTAITLDQATVTEPN